MVLRAIRSRAINFKIENMSYKISSLLINQGKKPKSIAEISISQPDEHKEKLIGKLFVLLEIDSAKSQNLKLASFLTHNINQNYYQNEQIYVLEKVKTIGVEDIFESALSKTNKDLIEFLNQEKIKVSPYAINLTVGVVCGNKLLFSTIGKNKTLLIYPTGKQKYKVTDIGGGAKPEQTANLLKLFPEIIDGEMPKKSYFFVANETLTEYLSEKQMIDIISKLPPLSAVGQIENMLGKLNLNTLFAGIILQNTSTPPTKEEKEGENPSSSRVDVDRTQKKTEKILKPAGILHFRSVKEYFYRVSGKFHILNRLPGKKNKDITNGDKNAEPSKQFFFKDKIFFKKRPGISSFLSKEKLKNATRSVFSAIHISLACIFQLLTSKEKILSLLTSIKDKIKGFFISVRDLKMIHKILMILIIASIAGAVITTKQRSEEKENQMIISDIEDLSGTISKNQNKIDSYLLYENTKSASEAIKENQDLLEELKNLAEGNPEAAAKINIAELEEKHDRQVKDIKHEAVLADPVVLADLSKANSEANPKNLLFYDGFLYAGDGTNSTIFRINKEDGQILAIENGDIGIEELKYPTGSGDHIYYFNSGEMAALNTENNEISSNAVNLPDVWSNAGIASYSRWLYMLDPKNNEIYKYTANAGNVTTRRNWTRENIDLSKTVDIDIDGTIYALHRDGEVTQMLNGEDMKFKLEENDIIDIQDASRLQVSDEIDAGFIYILDKGTKRLFVYNKKGKFINQYTSDKIDDPLDFYADSKAGKLYILNGTELVRFDINLPEE